MYIDSARTHFTWELLVLHRHTCITQQAMVRSNPLTCTWQFNIKMSLLGHEFEHVSTPHAFCATEAKCKLRARYRNGLTKLYRFCLYTFVMGSSGIAQLPLYNTVHHSAILSLNCTWQFYVKVSFLGG